MEVGFLGLGIMGKAMSINLLRQGFKVTVWNRTLNFQVQEVSTGGVLGKIVCNLILPPQAKRLFLEFSPMSPSLWARCLGIFRLPMKWKMVNSQCDAAKTSQFSSSKSISNGSFLARFLSRNSVAYHWSSLMWQNGLLEKVVGLLAEATVP